MLRFCPCLLICSTIFFLAHDACLVGSARQLDAYDLRIAEGIAWLIPCPRSNRVLHLGARVVDVRHDRRTLKIANGISLGKNSSRFPYSVLLAFRESSSSGRSQLRVCAGVLFRRRWVLTAGSCMNRVQDVKQLFVGIGGNAPKPEELIERNEATLAQDFIIYPNFTGNPRDGADLALVYLREPVRNTTIPRFPHNLDMTLGDGSRLVGLGWGVTDVNSNFADRLQVADQFAFSTPELCEAMWNRVNNVSAMIDSSVICAQPITRHENDASVSICEGDEGGPLLFLDVESFDANSRLTFEGRPEVDIVHGIASFGPKKCGAQEFSVFTNLSEYIDWIDTTIHSYVPRNPSDADAAEDDQDTLVIILVVLGVIILTITVIAWLKCRSPQRRRSGSVEISSATGLKNAAEANQRNQELAQMRMSPFLAAEFMSEENVAGIGDFSLQRQQQLPIDIKVKLAGRIIGSGGFGRVEEGLYVDPQGIHHKVAVKSVLFGEEESRDSLINEIRILERVGPHPNIVRCFGGCLHNNSRDENGYYIVEELMATDLEKFFSSSKQRKKITFETYLKIFQGTANGLEHLHHREVIHFDLKPSNILLDENHQPKLADFGCSRKRARSYITAGARGTVAYMAPELWLLGMYARRGQVRGEKIDVFSFGVVMWEALTNRKPIDPLSLQELFVAMDDEAASEQAEVKVGGTNEDFRTDRFPFDDAQCPDPLKVLIWDCVSYYNNLRPSFKEVKERIVELLQMGWIGQNVDQYCS